LHGLSATSITGSIEETIREEQARQNNALDIERASSLSTTDKNVANTHSNDGRDGSSPEPQGWESRVELGSGSQRQLERNASQELGNPDKFGTQVQTEGEYPSKQVLGGSSEAWRATVGEYWRIEPEVGRVANGVSGRVDRIKQLGNAVVPQIPELIGRAILKAQL
jgi:site-specific DNA-cytosine methylase